METEPLRLCLWRRPARDPRMCSVPSPSPPRNRPRGSTRPEAAATRARQPSAALVERPGGAHRPHSGSRPKGAGRAGRHAGETGNLRARAGHHPARADQRRGCRRRDARAEPAAATSSASARAAGDAVRSAGARRRALRLRDVDRAVRPQPHRRSRAAVTDVRERYGPEQERRADRDGRVSALGCHLTAGGARGPARRPSAPPQAGCPRIRRSAAGACRTTRHRG